MAKAEEEEERARDHEAEEVEAAPAVHEPKKKRFDFLIIQEWL